MKMKFKNTIVALSKYEAGRAARDYLWENVKTNTDVKHCEEIELQDVNQVRRAFLVDTSNINIWSTVSLMSISAIKEIVGY